MGWTRTLLVAIAEHLGAAGVGTWQAEGAYPAGVAVPLFIGSVPGSPDRVLVLSAYGVSDDPDLTDVVQGLQVRSRGGRGLGAPDVDDLADAAYDSLHGLHGISLGGIPVVLCRRASWTPLGEDDNSRSERSDNYHLNVMRPSTHRTD